MATETTVAPPRRKETLDSAVIRFAGDSGDGMQITGSQFTNTTALFGNDLATFPDFPAEIRAPAGTLPGVSGFQIHFGAKDIFTPGDAVDVLIAMNPAALKMNLADLKKGGILIVNVDNFKETDLKKAQVAVSPLEDRSLEGYRLFPVELTKLTRAALKDLGLDAKSMDRCKNFFALGMCYWLYNRTMDATHRWLDEKFGAKPVLAEANKLALKAGYAFCDATEAFQVTYEVPPAKLAPGIYRNLSGNTALAMGFVVAAQKAGLRLFQGSYPITPASDILHELSMYKEFGVITFQAEDEIAAITSAIGAVVRRLARDHHHLGPRHGAQGRGDRARDDGRAAARDRRHPARRPVDRPADQDRAGRPVPGALRPQLRGAGAGDRGQHARRLLLGGARGEPHRAQVHDAGDPALGRLPRERRRAVAHPRGLASCPRSPSRSAPSPRASGPTSASRTRWRGRGPCRARRGSSTASAASRSRTSPATSTTSRSTTSAWSSCARRRSPAIVQDMPDVVPAGDPDGELLIVGWGSTYGAITAALRSAARGRATASATCTCATSTRCPATWARC